MSLGKEIKSKDIKVSRLHPCFGGKAHNKYGRIHLPVSPACNIQCRFCSRTLNKTEERPGVTGQVLKPEETPAIVNKALELCPEITVVGIAGPGDTLATDNALKAFELVHSEHPELIKCLSTNGLLLPQKAKQLADVGVRSVTVTVNAVDPVILDKIVSHIIYNGVRLTGLIAAEILIGSQLEGIEKVAALGVTLKVNTVLIPGVNDKHISEISKAVKAAGANIYNIIPLIPQGEFINFKAPTCDDLAQARKSASDFLEVFYHCKHCRADACGIPGKEDLSSKLYDRQPDTFSHG
ncbi:radical SAM protein [Endomicrobium proavitum]|uniref:FeMo cofactor biosynthesis protein NifB n=1 Tax=Endomicrobium proavitum TaxID=1408281 RepID=A0A0G3WJL3_9BACT|nr:radical SAM protein [Endomicrobium proavitum]AKL98070.1 radical SAM protein [Endomicrobium proavitum]